MKNIHEEIYSNVDKIVCGIEREAFVYGDVNGILKYKSFLLINIDIEKALSGWDGDIWNPNGYKKL